MQYINVLSRNKKKTCKICSKGKCQRYPKQQFKGEIQVPHYAR